MITDTIFAWNKTTILNTQSYRLIATSVYRMDILLGINVAFK